MALVGSISIANRLSKPLTFVASLENFCPNASERLCAGSVDYMPGWICDIHMNASFGRTISSTDSRTCDSWMAREQDVVVLPRYKIPVIVQCQRGMETHLRHPFHLLHDRGNNVS